MLSPIAGVILAGGRASRMGGTDKGMLTIGHSTLLERVIGRLEPQVTALALNANGDPSRFLPLALDIVADPLPEQVGPLGGILAAMRWAAAHKIHFRRVVTVAADTPFFPEDLVRSFLETAGDNEERIVLAGSGGRPHPTFGLWPTGLADDLAAHISSGQPRRVTAYAIEKHGAAIADFAFSAGFDPFFNINTPEDLAAARGAAETGPLKGEQAGKQE